MRLVVGLMRGATRQARRQRTQQQIEQTRQTQVADLLQRYGGNS